MYMYVFCMLLLCSNESWYDVGSYYKGVYGENISSVDVPPTPDVFYILNFDNILRSYGMCASTMDDEGAILFNSSLPLCLCLCSSLSPPPLSLCSDSIFTNGGQ